MILVSRRRHRRDVQYLTEALRLTAEYAMLPALPGWSWYDAVSAYNPAQLSGYPDYTRRSGFAGTEEVEGR